jgi:hypothetical protein
VRGSAGCATGGPERVHKNNNFETIVQNGVQVVGGSNPLASTKKKRNNRGLGGSAKPLIFARTIFLAL